MPDIISHNQIVSAQVRAAYVAEVLSEIRIEKNISDEPKFNRRQADILNALNLYNASWVDLFYQTIDEFMG